MKKMILTFAVIVLSKSAFAATSFEYKCDYVAGDDPGATNTSLSINANEATVDQDGTKVTAKRARDYSPHSGDENYVEYTGADDLGGDEGTGEILAEKKLLHGAEEGKIKIRFRGEGFDNTVYTCTRQ